jgi:hypothetical protein
MLSTCCTYIQRDILISATRIEADKCFLHDPDGRRPGVEGILSLSGNLHGTITTHMDPSETENDRGGVPPAGMRAGITKHVNYTGCEAQLKT